MTDRAEAMRDRLFAADIITLCRNSTADHRTAAYVLRACDYDVALAGQLIAASDRLDMDVVVIVAALQREARVSASGLGQFVRELSTPIGSRPFRLWLPLVVGSYFVRRQHGVITTAVS